MPRTAGAQKTAKRAYLDPAQVRTLTNALSRIEGHVGAVKRMVRERRCADDLLTQLAAVRAALNRVTAKVVEEELLSCLSWWGSHDPVEAEERFQRSMDALTRMLKKS